MAGKSSRTNLGVSDIQKLKLVSPIPPSVNHYLGWRAIIKNNRPMAVSYETSEAKKYKKDFIRYVKDEVVKQNWSLPLQKTQHFYADCKFYFARVDQDPNNYYKLPWDAITETQAIWVDDNVVCERCNGILYDSKKPRIEIEIYPVDYIGIFDNKAQLDDFKSNCIGCNRYKRNCSILRNAIGGKVQDEIIGMKCLKFKMANAKEK